MTAHTPLSWLLDTDNPSARYLALRDLLDRPADDSELVAARSAIVRSAPVRAILDAQYPAGYWIKPDRGYSPKHKATIWQLIFLSDLGASTCWQTPCAPILGCFPPTRTALASTLA